MLVIHKIAYEIIILKTQQVTNEIFTSVAISSLLKFYRYRLLRTKIYQTFAISYCLKLLLQLSDSCKMILLLLANDKALIENIQPISIIGFKVVHFEAW